MLFIYVIYLSYYFLTILYMSGQIQQTQPNILPIKEVGGATETFDIMRINEYLDKYINTNKYFIGISMLLLNICGKFVTISFSKSAEEYLKMTISKQILIFSMGILATRCLITAIILTASFTILSDHLFNEESPYCIVPMKYRILHKIPNTDNEELTETQITDAIQILERSKRENQRKMQITQFGMYHDYMQSPNKI